MDSNQLGPKKSLFQEMLPHLGAMAVFYPLAALANLLWNQHQTIFISVTVALLLQLTVTFLIVHKQRQRVSAQISSQYTEKISALEKELADQLSINRGQLEKSDTCDLRHFVDMRKFAERTEQHHQFVHVARDLAVKMMGDLPRGTERSTSLVPQEFQNELRTMLDHLATMFQMLVPEGTKVFTAIRERIKAGKKEEWKTIVRGGACNHSRRQQDTIPLRLEMKMVGDLKESFKNRDCVTLTGSSHPNWSPMRNDALGEDKSVLMGAVFSKKWDTRKAKYTPVSMEWIICVAANTENAFTDEHKPLMKCFNDLFAILLNTFLRQGAV